MNTKKYVGLVKHTKYLQEKAEAKEALREAYEIACLKDKATRMEAENAKEEG